MNLINVDRYSILPTKSDLYFDDEAYQDRKVVFCRHPFGEYANDLYSLENIKPEVLFREPLIGLVLIIQNMVKRFDTRDLNTVFIDNSLKIKKLLFILDRLCKKNDAKDFYLSSFQKLF